MVTQPTGHLSIQRQLTPTGVRLRDFRSDYDVMCQPAYDEALGGFPNLIVGLIERGLLQLLSRESVED